VDSLAWNADIVPAVVTPIAADFVDDGGIAQPSKLTFDAVVAKSDTEIVSLQNCGTTPLLFTSATVAPSDVFSIDSQPPPSLLPGIVGAVAIKFTPNRVGVVTGTLTIEAPTGTLTVELDASGRGGTGTSGTPATFYGCGCRSSDPGGAFAFGVVLLVVRRRRSRR
jgi:MYXO-CTERM domain-containing protein